METFGLLKILRSALSSEKDTAPPPERPEAEKGDDAPEPAPEERENAFLKLMQKHDALSRNIDRNKKR